MSFRGGRGGSPGGFRGKGPQRGGGGFRGGRGGGRGGFGGGDRSFDAGPPDVVVELGQFMHPCESELICKNTNEKIPYFNAPVYLENKTLIGKVDEIFGTTSDCMFTVKPIEGVIATSFKAKDKVYIGTDKLLPMSRFLPPAPGEKRPPSMGRGGFGGRGRGGGPGDRGRGGFGGGRGRGAPRGAPRGAFRGRF